MGYGNKGSGKKPSQIIDFPEETPWQLLTQKILQYWAGQHQWSQRGTSYHRPFLKENYTNFYILWEISDFSTGLAIKKNFLRMENLKNLLCSEISTGSILYICLNTGSDILC